MSNVSMRLMLEAGVHFGHQTRKWNPKMREYIFIARGGIHIIDLQKTMAAVGPETSAPGTDERDHPPHGPRPLRPGPSLLALRHRASAPGPPADLQRFSARWRFRRRSPAGGMAGGRGGRTFSRLKAEARVRAAFREALCGPRNGRRNRWRPLPSYGTRTMATRA